jgi:hypothetical protein
MITNGIVMIVTGVYTDVVKVIQSHMMRWKYSKQFSTLFTVESS